MTTLSLVLLEYYSVILAKTSTTRSVEVAKRQLCSLLSLVQNGPALLVDESLLLIAVPAARAVNLVNEHSPLSWEPDECRDSCSYSCSRRNPATSTEDVVYLSHGPYGWARTRHIETSFFVRWKVLLSVLHALLRAQDLHAVLMIGL